MHKVIIYPLGFLLIPLSHLPYLSPSGCHQGPTGANYTQHLVTEAPPTWGWLLAQCTPTDSQPSKHAHDWGSQGFLSSIAIRAVNRKRQRHMARKKVAGCASPSSFRAIPISALLPER